ncbi:MAG: divalent metal cation transporter [Pseudomonadota bacterium]|nr:divalent metal cation transporter [Pseudomonadota bacterium]
MTVIIKRLHHLARILGPGMLFAAASIGGSHLIQSTRAGANYGFIIIGVVILINLIKYPFFEFGQRYTAVTQQNLLQGYACLGRWTLLLYFILTLSTAFLTIATVSFITANIAGYMIGATISPLVFSIAILSLCASVVFIGHYEWLERTVKVILVILAVSTIAAVIIAWPENSARAMNTPTPDMCNLATLGFMLALMGWMPAPLDVSVWTSLWTRRRQRDYQTHLTRKDTMLDFNIGYLFSSVLAVVFVGLGTLVMFGTGETFAESGIKFIEELITLYTAHIGSWSRGIIEIVAISTMFSTTITCLDAYPRSLSTTIFLAYPPMKKYYQLMYWYSVLILFFGSIILSGYFIKGMRDLLDVTATLAFLTAPLYAYLNYRVVTHDEIMPKEHQPGKWMLVWARLGLVFLIIVGILFITWHILAI